MSKIHSSQDLGNAVRSSRTLQKITQKQLAAMCGIGIRFIVDLEKGKPTCALDKALKVAQMLGLNLNISEK